jgi:hypothetical protein
MTFEYILTILLQGSPAPVPVITVAIPYTTKESCMAAGKAIAAADKAARKTEKNYIAFCRGTLPKAAPDAPKHQG